jgi:ABC-type uncharacterized transport system involved in gliding motility auxiliary subunit
MSRFSSLLGGLGLVAVGFGLLSALLAIFQPITDLTWIIGNLAIGVLLLSAGLFAGFDNVRQRLRSGEARRVGKYGSSAVLGTVLGIALLCMLGFLAHRHPLRFDWSEAQVNTLTDQSLELLGRLEGEVRVTAFFQQTEIPQVSGLLDRYAYESDAITLEFVDPNSVPLRVQQLGLDPEALAKGLIRLEQDGEGIVVSDLSEAGMTNGLLKLVSSSDKKVYFLSGHNERPIANQEGAPAEGKESVGRAAEALRNETYAVESLAMATLGEIPEDADVVIIAGPTQPYFSHETDALRAYLAGGGALLVMIDPRARTNLYEPLVDWGVEMGDDVVVDQVRAIFNQATMPLAAEYSSEHPITSGIRQTTVFPMVRSVQPAPESEGDLEIIVLTGADSWAERDLDGWMETGRALYDEGDLNGPVPIAVAGRPALAAADDGAAAGEAEPRLVVFGDSEFASNEYIEAHVNRDLFLNAVNWLMGDVEQIGVRPRLSRASRFELDAGQFRGIVYLSLFVLPETIAVIGVVAWWLRRESAER